VRSRVGEGIIAHIDTGCSHKMAQRGRGASNALTSSKKLARLGRAKPILSALDIHS